MTMRLPRIHLAFLIATCALLGACKPNVPPQTSLKDASVGSGTGACASFDAIGGDAGPSGEAFPGAAYRRVGCQNQVAAGGCNSGAVEGSRSSSFEFFEGQSCESVPLYLDANKARVEERAQKEVPRKLAAEDEAQLDSDERAPVQESAEALAEKEPEIDQNTCTEVVAGSESCQDKQMGDSCSGGRCTAQSESDRRCSCDDPR